MIQGLDLQKHPLLHDNDKHLSPEEDRNDLDHPSHHDYSPGITRVNHDEGRSRCRYDEEQQHQPHPFNHELSGRKHTLSWPHLQLEGRQVSPSSSPLKQTRLLTLSPPKRIEGKRVSDGIEDKSSVNEACTTSSSSSDRERPSSTSSTDLNKHLEGKEEEEYVMDCRDDDNKSSNNLKDNAEKLFNALERLSFTDSYTSRLLTTSDSQDEDEEDR
jgi:hypothetical protein